MSCNKSKHFLPRHAGRKLGPDARPVTRGGKACYAGGLTLREALKTAGGKIPQGSGGPDATLIDCGGVVPYWKIKIINF